MQEQKPEPIKELTTTHEIEVVTEQVMGATLKRTDGLYFCLGERGKSDANIIRIHSLSALKHEVHAVMWLKVGKKVKMFRFGPVASYMTKSRAAKAVRALNHAEESFDGKAPIISTETLQRLENATQEAIKQMEEQQ